MSTRPAPAPTETITYDLDKIKAGAKVPFEEWPTLRQILDYATASPDATLYDDEEQGEEFAATLDEYRNLVSVPGPFVITVADAQKLHAAAKAHLDYALENNYDSDSEDDVEAYRFAQFGPLLLDAMSHPWTALTLQNDGYHGWQVR